MIRVNSTEFDDNAVVAEMQYHSAETQDAAKNKACESLIIAELIKQRAKEMGISLEDAGTQDESINALLEQELDIPVASDEDCLAYFSNNPNKFKTSPLVSVRHILIPAAPDDANARSEALDQGKVIIKQLQDDIGLFSALAGQFSGCPSSKVGGQLGQISKGQTVPEFERQLFNCNEGLVSSPIESRYGVHIVDIDHAEQGKPLAYDMVNDRIADYLNEKVKRKAIAHYIETLISDADIEGFDFSVSDSPLLQ